MQHFMTSLGLLTHGCLSIFHDPFNSTEPTESQTLILLSLFSMSPQNVQIMIPIPKSNLHDMTAYLQTGTQADPLELRVNPLQHSLTVRILGII